MSCFLWLVWGPYHPKDADPYSSSSMYFKNPSTLKANKLENGFRRKQCASVPVKMLLRFPTCCLQGVRIMMFQRSGFCLILKGSGVKSDYSNQR